MKSELLSGYRICYFVLMVFIYQATAAVKIVISQNNVGTPTPMSYTNQGHSISIERDSTNINLKVAESCVWRDGKWQFNFHTGLDFNNQIFNIDGRKYPLLLLHAVPSGLTNIGVQAFDEGVSLENVLRHYTVEQEGAPAYVRTYPIGVSRVQLDYLHRTLTPFLSKSFVWAPDVMTKRIQQQRHMLNHYNETNSMDFALRAAKVLRPGDYVSFEDFAISSSLRAIGNVVRNSHQFPCTANWGTLVTYTKLIARYKKISSHVQIEARVTAERIEALIRSHRPGEPIDVPEEPLVYDFSVIADSLTIIFGPPPHGVSMQI